MGLAEEEVLIRDDSGLLLETGESRVPKSQEWRKKLTKTICLSLGFLVLGLCVAIPGPTLLDLEDQVKATTFEMMLVFVSRSIGYLLGALLGGVLFDCFDKQLLLFCTLLIASVATVAIPWSLTLVVMAAMFALQGITMGALDTGGNVFCIQLWGKKNPPFIQTLHFAFGIGAFIAPLLAKPFLSDSMIAHNTTSIVQGNIPVNAFAYGELNHNRSKRFLDIGFLDDRQLDSDKYELLNLIEDKKNLDEENVVQMSKIPKFLNRHRKRLSSYDDDGEYTGMLKLKRQQSKRDSNSSEPDSRTTTLKPDTSDNNQLSGDNDQTALNYQYHGFFNVIENVKYLEALVQKINISEFLNRRMKRQSSDDDGEYTGMWKWKRHQSKRDLTSREPGSRTTTLKPHTVTSGGITAVLGTSAQKQTDFTSDNNHLSDDIDKTAQNATSKGSVNDNINANIPKSESVALNDTKTNMVDVHTTTTEMPTIVKPDVSNNSKVVPTITKNPDGTKATNSSAAASKLTTIGTSNPTTTAEKVHKPSAATDKDRKPGSADGKDIGIHLNDHKNDLPTDADDTDDQNTGVLGDEDKTQDMVEDESDTSNSKLNVTTASNGNTSVNISQFSSETNGINKNLPVTKLPANTPATPNNATGTSQNAVTVPTVKGSTTPDKNLTSPTVNSKGPMDAPAAPPATESSVTTAATTVQATTAPLTKVKTTVLTATTAAAAQTTTSTAAQTPASTVAQTTTSTAAQTPASTAAQTTTSTAAQTQASTAAQTTTSTAAQTTTSTAAAPTTKSTTKTTVPLTTTVKATVPFTTDSKTTVPSAATTPATPETITVAPVTTTTVKPTPSAAPTVKTTTEKLTPKPVTTLKPNEGSTKTLEPSVTENPSVQDTTTHNVSVSNSSVTVPNTTLSGDEVSTTEVSMKPESAVGTFINNAIHAVKNISRIQFAYLIIGVALFLIAVIFLVLYCKDKRRLTSDRDRDELERFKSELTCTKATLIILLGLFFFCYTGLEVTFGALVTAFAVDFNHWPKEQGAMAAAIFWGALATGRGLSIFFARCCGPTVMLVFDVIFMIIGGLVLSIGIHFYDKLLWLGTLILGLGMSSAFPAGISWAEKYFHLTGKSTAFFVIGSALGQMVIPVVTGYLYENFGAIVLMYSSLTLSIITLVIFIAMQCVAVRNKGTLKVHERNGFLPLEDADADDNLEMDDFVHFDKLQTRKRRDKRRRANVEYHTLISDLEDD